jgi:hypothetical protein
VTDLAAGSGRAFRRREERRLAKTSRGARREEATDHASPDLPSVAVVAPQRSMLAAWVISDFPNATLSGLGIAAVALALFFGALRLSPLTPISTSIDERVEFGAWIIAHHAVPRVDDFYWWMSGKPWQDSEWLADVIFTLVYRASGWAGETLLIAAAIAAAGLIMGLTCARRLGGLPLLIAIGLSANVLSVFAIARGQTLALPLIAAWVAGLLTARDENRSPSFWLLLVVLVLVQLHGLFLFALLLLGPFALEATMEAPAGTRFLVARAWATFGLAAIAVAMINPYGLDAFTFPFRLASMEILKAQVFMEWQPLDFVAQYRLDAFIAALVGGTLLLPMRMNPIGVAIVVALFGMTFQHQRAAMLLTLITPMLLAGPIANALEQKRVLDWRRAARIATLAVVTVGAIFSAESLSWPIERESGMGTLKDGSLFPVFVEMGSALKAVPPALRSHRVYNDAGSGPWLIGQGVRVMVDDRAELYGSEGQPAFAYTWLDDNGVDWTFDGPNSPLDMVINADPRWVSLYRGNIVSVHARKSVLDAVKGGAP